LYTVLEGQGQSIGEGTKPGTTVKGALYDGSWKMGVRTGQGTYTGPAAAGENKVKYHGDFMNGLITGTVRATPYIAERSFDQNLCFSDSQFCRAR